MTTYSNDSSSGSGDAVQRYQYLLRTAAPEQIEQAHEQAFAQMTAAERRQVLQLLSGTSEQPADDSAAALARSATRLEVSQPGALQSALGNAKAAAGSQTGKTLLASVAGGFIGSGLFSALTGGDGIGGRPGLFSRLFGGGLLGGGLLGSRAMGGGMPVGMAGGFGGGGGLFGGGAGGRGGWFGGGGPGGPGEGFFGGGPGGPGVGGPGGSFGGPGGGPGGPGF